MKQFQPKDYEGRLMLHVILNPFPPVSVTVSKTALQAGCVVSNERSLLSQCLLSRQERGKKCGQRSFRDFSIIYLH